MLGTIQKGKVIDKNDEAYYCLLYTSDAADDGEV